MKQLNSYDSYRKLANLCHNILGIPARWFLYINTNVQTSSLNADVYVQADKVSQEEINNITVQKRGVQGPNMAY